MKYAKDENISRLNFELTLTIKLDVLHSYKIFNSETKRICSQWFVKSLMYYNQFDYILLIFLFNFSITNKCTLLYCISWRLINIYWKKIIELKCVWQSSCKFDMKRMYWILFFGSYITKYNFIHNTILLAYLSYKVRGVNIIYIILYTYYIGTNTNLSSVYN